MLREPWSSPSRRAWRRQPREVLASARSDKLSLEDELRFVVDREWPRRDNRCAARRIKEARLSRGTFLEDVECDAARDVEKLVIEHSLRASERK